MPSSPPSPQRAATAPAARRTASQARLIAQGEREHPRCLLCGAAHPAGLRLAFQVQADGAVAAEFDCSALLQGYPGMLHGGVVAAVLDAAMTNALFAHGLCGLTAELTVRYLAPVRLDRPARVVAAFCGARWRAPYCFEAELLQAGRRVARARGKFLAMPAPARVPSGAADAP